MAEADQSLATTKKDHLLTWAKLAVAVAVVRNTLPHMTARCYAETLCSKFYERQVKLQTEVEEARSQILQLTQDRTASLSDSSSQAKLQTSQLQLQASQVLLQAGHLPLQTRPAPVQIRPNQLQENQALLQGSWSSLQASQIPLEARYNPLQESQALIQESQSSHQASQIPLEARYNPLQESQALLQGSQSSIQASQIPQEARHNPLQESQALLQESQSSLQASQVQSQALTSQDIDHILKIQKRKLGGLSPSISPDKSNSLCSYSSTHSQLIDSRALSQTKTVLLSQPNKGNNADSSQLLQSVVNLQSLAMDEIYFEINHQIVLAKASACVEVQGNLLSCDTLTVSDTLVCQAASAVCEVMHQHVWLEDEVEFMSHVCALVDLSMDQLRIPSQLGQYPAHRRKHCFTAAIITYLCESPPSLSSLVLDCLLDALQAFCQHLLECRHICQPVNSDIYESGFFLLECLKQAVTKWRHAEQTSLQEDNLTERNTGRVTYCCLHPQLLVQAQEKLGHCAVSIGRTFPLVGYQFVSISEQLEAFLQNIVTTRSM